VPAFLSGHRDCPKKNNARSREQTGVGAHRNRRLSLLGHLIPNSHIILYVVEHLEGHNFDEKSGGNRALLFFYILFYGYGNQL